MISSSPISAQKKSSHSAHWKIVAVLPAAKGQQKALGFAGPAAGVYENKLFVGGGANYPDSMPWQGGKKKYYNDIYVYTKEGKKVVKYKKTFKLAANIAYTANCSTSQGILFAGGENEEGISNKAELLQWDSGVQNVIIKNLPDLPVAVTNAAATVNGNIIYVAGGETATVVSDQFYSLDLGNIASGWKQLPPLPKPVSHTVLSVQSNGQDSCIYLTGGRKKNTNGISDLYSSVFEFDIKKNQWSEKKSLPYPLCAGTGIAFGSNCILLFGGDRGETFHKVETIIAAINAEKDETKKQELVRQKNKLLASHPGFSKKMLLYNTLTDEWKEMGNIPFDTPVTTVALQWGKKVLIPCGEIKAGVRTPQILSAKLNLKCK